MKFKANEDVDAPLEQVWQRFIDFSDVENEARRRGASLKRVGDWMETAAGVEWRGKAIVRGKERAIASRVAVFQPEELCVVDSRIGGMDCHYEMTFIRLSASVTRVSVVLELSANTLTARLILQAMRLARGRVLQRLQGMLSRQGNAAEAAYRRSRSA